MEENLITRCINNLLDNSTKHAKKVNIELNKKIITFLLKLKMMVQVFQKPSMKMYLNLFIKLIKAGRTQNQALDWACL